MIFQRRLTKYWSYPEPRDGAPVPIRGTFGIGVRRHSYNGAEKALWPVDLPEGEWVLRLTLRGVLAKGELLVKHLRLERALPANAEWNAE